MTDYTIASKITTPQLDPLATIGKLNAAQQGLLNNKILGQNIAQTLAQRAAAQGAVGSDGNFDVDKYESALASGGAAPEAIKGAQDIRQQQLQNQIAKLGLSKDQMALSAQELGNGAMVAQGVLANGTQDPNALSKAAISQAIEQNLIQPGLIKSPEGIAHAKSLEAMMTDDPKQNAALLQQFVNQSTDITKAMGAVQQTNTGSHIVQQRINPATGVPTTTGVLALGMSPGEAVSPNYTVMDDEGRPGVVTKGATAAAQKNGGAPTVIPTGPAAGTIEAQVGQKAESQKQYSADLAEAGGFSQRMQGLNNAERAVRAAQTGKGGQAIQDWKSLVNTIAPGMVSSADKAKIVNYDEARKYLQDYVSRRGAALGLGTDAAREMVHSANPSVDISNAAAVDMLPVIKGLERMQNAQVALAQQQKVQPGNYSSWRANLNRSLDPAGFMADQIPAAERVKYFDSLKPPQQAKYVNAVKAAIQAGYFTAADLRK